MEVLEQLALNCVAIVKIVFGSRSDFGIKVIKVREKPKPTLTLSLSL